MAVEYRDVRPGARVANLRLRSLPLIVETDYWVGGWADGCHSRVLRGTGRAPRDGGGLRAEGSFGGPTARSAADLRYHRGWTFGTVRLAARAGSHGGGDGVHRHLLAAGLEHPRGPGVRAAAGERPQGQERPGRKTDQRDAEWLAQLLRCGPIERSYVPAVEQRDLRDLTRRRRRLLQTLAAEKNRVHKTLQDANVKLTTSVSDIFGVSGRALVQALRSGQKLDSEEVLALLKGKLRQKAPEVAAALEGRVRPHHLEMIEFSMDHIDFLERQVQVIEERIEATLAPPFREARDLICSIPGIERASATEILAEIGIDMSVFHSEAHLASWAGVSPGNFESAGKSKSGRTGRGDRYLKTVLVQAGWAASKTKATRLSGRYQRLARRLGRDGK